jgi:hypothetical protein
MCEWLGSAVFELSPPPVGMVIFEYVEDVILLDRQFILGVGFIVIEGYMDFEHSCTEQTREGI